MVRSPQKSFCWTVVNLCHVAQVSAAPGYGAFRTGTGVSNSSFRAPRDSRAVAAYRLTRRDEQCAKDTITSFV